jgi:hypothetical protein
MPAIYHEDFNAFCSSLSATCCLEADAARDIDFTVVYAFKGD